MKWEYINGGEDWDNSVQISPDGTRLLVKEMSRNIRNGLTNASKSTTFYLIDISTCKKSGYTLSGAVNTIEDNKAN